MKKKIRAVHKELATMGREQEDLNEGAANCFAPTGKPKGLNSADSAECMATAKSVFEEAASTMHLNGLDNWNVVHKQEWEKGSMKRNFKEKTAANFDHLISQLCAIPEDARKVQRWQHQL